MYHGYLKRALDKDFGDGNVEKPKEHVHSRTMKFTRTKRYAETQKPTKPLHAAVTDTTDEFLGRIDEVKKVVDNVLAERPPCDNLDGTNMKFPQSELPERVCSNLRT